MIDMSSGPWSASHLTTWSSSCALFLGVEDFWTWSLFPHALFRAGEHEDARAAVLSRWFTWILSEGRTNCFWPAK